MTLIKNIQRVLQIKRSPSRGVRDVGIHFVDDIIEILWEKELTHVWKAWGMEEGVYGAVMIGRWRRRCRNLPFRKNLCVNMSCAAGIVTWIDSCIYVNRDDYFRQ